MWNSLVFKGINRLLKESLILRMSSNSILDSKQTSISNFFSKPHKRSSRDALLDEIPGKVKKGELNKNCEASSYLPLSPEQKRIVEDKKLEAIEKLKRKQVSKMDMGASWKKALENEFGKSYFIKLQQFLSSERKSKTIYPPENDVFRWTKFHAIEATKVVIIGQDPYHGPRQAHGLCFSVQIGVPPPPSLKNIFKELESDIPGFVRPKHGHLIGWASQGVLLLNACLTVVANQANSHKDKGWEQFTDATIKWINDNLDGVVFILWGNYAQKKGKFLNKTRHLVLTGKHPSPLSAHGGFFGCKHFSKANEYLKGKGKGVIDWSHLPETL